MPIKIMKRYTRKQIKENPSVYYIFGDNYYREGMGGQAGEAREEPNAIGVRTKMDPAYSPKSFLTDKDFIFNIRAICDDLNYAAWVLHRGGIVVWPEDGIGTGLADLKTHAPQTLKFIDNLIESLKAVYGVVE